MRSVRVCSVCTTAPSKYTCPRCNVAYCALACYKAHSSACTENFYRTHVESEVELRRREDAADGSQRSDAAEMLRRVATFDAQAPRPWEIDADGSVAVAGETSRGSPRAAPAEADAHPPLDRAAFERAARAGRLAQFIQLWTPWWEETETRVVELDGSAPSSTCVSPLRALAGAHSPPPSPLLRYSVVDAITAYAFAARTYNGDWSYDAPGAAAVVLELSAVLDADARHASGADAVRSTLERFARSTHAPNGAPPSSVSRSRDAPLLPHAAAADAPLAAHALLVRDAACLLATPATVQRALRELGALFAAAARANRTLRNAARKVNFLQSWASEAFSALSALSAVRAELAVEFAAHASRREQAPAASGEWAPKTTASGGGLIEELQGLCVS